MAVSIETSLPRPLIIAVRTLVREFSGELVTSLADEANVSRPTVYAWEEAARQVLLESCVNKSLKRDELDCLKKRLVLVMRCGGMSIRAIVEAMRAIGWGQRMSYGRIQKFLKEAGERADAHLRKVSLSTVKSVAIDEMFSQGKPVLTGMDLDSGFIVCAELSEDRSGDTWTARLEGMKAQALNPRVMLKDAGSGMACGVRRVFPKAQARDDLLHAIYEMGKTRRYLLNKAYRAIEAEQKAIHAIERLKNRARRLRQDIRQRKARRQSASVDQDKLEELKAKLKEMMADLRRRRKALKHIKSQCERAVERYDIFETSTKDVAEAVEYIGLEDQQPSDPKAMKVQICNAADQMQALGDKRAYATGKYLFNRAAGLVQYMEPLNRDLTELANKHGSRPVYIAAAIFRYVTEIKRNRWPKDRKDDIKHTLELSAEFHQLAGERGKAIMEDVQDVLRHHHRATSALEGLHSIIRPRLYRQKHVSQHALALITFYQNHRIRRWGRHKGSSAHQILMGHRDPEDWLTALGYPLAQAA